MIRLDRGAGVVSKILDSTTREMQRLRNLLCSWGCTSLTDQHLGNMDRLVQNIKREIQDALGSITSTTPADLVQEIISGIWIGSESVLEENWLDSICPGYIVSVCSLRPLQIQRIQRMQATHRMAAVEDSVAGFHQVKLDLPEIFGEFCTAYLTGKPMIVHCRMGRSRSAAILIGFFALLADEPFDKTHQWMRKIRPQVYGWDLDTFMLGMWQYFGRSEQPMNREKIRFIVGSIEERLNLHVDEAVPLKNRETAVTEITQMRDAILNARQTPLRYLVQFSMKERADIEAQNIFTIFTQMVYLGNDKYGSTTLGIEGVFALPEEFNPTHIVSLCEGFWDFPEAEHLALPMEDSVEGFKTEFLSRFPELVKFVYQALVNQGQVFFFCQMGRSRSPSALILVLAYITGLSFDQVFHYVFLQRIAMQSPIRECGREFGENAGKPNVLWAAREWCNQCQ